MRQVLLYVAGLALLVGCSDHNGLPTDQAAGNPAEKPSFAGAEVERSNVALFIFDPAVGLLVTIGFAEGVTLADLCAGIPVDLSPNTVANVVIPPSEAFLAAAHGQDVPVLVYEFADDPCDGVGRPFSHPVRCCSTSPTYTRTMARRFRTSACAERWT